MEGRGRAALGWALAAAYRYRVYLLLAVIVGVMGRIAPTS